MPCIETSSIFMMLIYLKNSPCTVLSVGLGIDLDSEGLVSNVMCTASCEP
jgi:hypothetical protein